MMSNQVLALHKITLASSNAEKSWNHFCSRCVLQCLQTNVGIAKIRNIVCQSYAKELVHAFITARLKYCNSLL